MVAHADFRRAGTDDAHAVHGRTLIALRPDLMAASYGASLLADAARLAKPTVTALSRVARERGNNEP